MADITLRSISGYSGAYSNPTTKGSPLTAAEVDANFDNLNRYKIEASGTATSGYVLMATGTAAKPTWIQTTSVAGLSGYSGISGFSGISGYSGKSGYSGISGYSGFSGISGYSGFSGISGYSGFSGISGYSGFSGISGISGYSGTSGWSGWSGFSGISGYSGTSGWSGWSGWSGLSGFSGATGSVAAPSDDITTDATFYPLMVTGVGSTSTRTSSMGLNFNPSTGTLSATSFNSLSDAYQKTNIKPIEDSLNIICNLNGVNFDWKSNGLPSSGLIAQDVEKVMPQLVTDKEGTKSLNYNGIIGVLVEAIKDQQNQIEQLKVLLEQK